MQFAEAHQAFRQARGGIEESCVLRLSAGPAQACAAQAQELEREPRLMLEQFDEMVAPDRDEFRGGNSRC